MSTTNTTDAQNTKASTVTTSSQNPQQITPQISLTGELTTSVDNPTASGSVAPGESRTSLRPTDTLVKIPSNSCENLKKRLDANVEVLRAQWEEREARRLRRESRRGGSK
jgi:hypothetical protein